MSLKFCKACGVELVRRPGERDAQWASRRACSVRHANYRPDAERFVEKYTVNPETGCWEWTAKINQQGYGIFILAMTGRRYVNAHRFALILAGVDIPDGLVVDHLCRVRHCVNPEHLQVTTNRTNLLRGVGWSGLNFRRTHCVHGHRFDEANTIVRKRSNGAMRRFCRECNNARERARRAARRAERAA